MKAVFVIDVDKDELGKAVATITAEENDITFFAKGVIRPLPKRIPTNEYGYMTPYGSVWNACLAEITGETE